MGVEELTALCEEGIIADIEQNIEREHTLVALDKSLCHSSLVATQVKYLQRAKTKLPSYYAARCVMVPRAFEQSSSEAAAEHKGINGEAALELTCGLGVDTLSLSRRFARVVTLERDEVLAAVARENFRRLGIDNVEVLSTTAEEYLASCEERFDWVYVDPDRRSADGRKMVLLEDCSPNIISLWGDIERVARRVAVKCSPLFDVDEAFRLFPRSSVEVVSLADECKEVNIYIDNEGVERIGATALGRGSVWIDRSEISVPRSRCQARPFEEYRHLIIPDVSLQKGRIATKTLTPICDIWSDNGYGLATEGQISGYIAECHLARILPIDSIHTYTPKVCRKILSERGIARAEVMKREYPHSMERILKELKIKEGGDQKIAFTKLNNQHIMIILSKSR